ncbi:hypothetical protein [Mesoaciditoga lauensis]|uniref:hypothetical protein n=1 Tax=Mesoaciditoga lauensis TaxID=1495039 RepID=UPI00056217FD|nr:hypothetical protein [Mesoaciditoga lauensis]
MFFHRKAKKEKKEGPFYPEENSLVAYVQSNKGSLFKSYFRKGYDFRANYGQEGAPIVLDKELLGNSFEDRVFIHAEFDENYKLKSYKIDKGRFLTPEEYEELLKSKEEKEK